MKNVIKRLCSTTIAVITLITGTAIPVMAEKNAETEKYTELQSPRICPRPRLKSNRLIVSKSTSRHIK